MSRLQRYNPGPGMADMWEYFRRPQPYRWPILAASALPIILILLWANSEERLVEPDRPKVTYISTLAPDRSDEEILASNLANQQRQDERRTQIEAAEQRKRELYRALGAASGMDVETMERQAAAERAREKAKAEAFRKNVLNNRVVPGAADAALRGSD
ncbi:MAG: hypothetical protein APF78_05825 [Sphingomonadales bacterium BRH_c3]|nr:MAG: hypothetical protein APF78_05825 [Sphingomonadales bacterium BRH_c3]